MNKHLKRLVGVATALVVSASALVATTQPASAQYSGQEICLAPFQTSNNDGTVRLYLAGYARHSDIYLDLVRDQCFKIPDSRDSDIVYSMQFRFQGKQGAKLRWRLLDAGSPTQSGEWHVVASSPDKLRTLGDTRQRFWFQVDSDAN